MMQDFVTGIINLVFNLLDWLFGLFGSFNIPISWVPHAKGLMDWATYFLPVDTLYIQFKIIFSTLVIYITMRLIKLIRSY